MVSKLEKRLSRIKKLAIPYYKKDNMKRNS